MLFPCDESRMNHIEVGSQGLIVCSAGGAMSAAPSVAGFLVAGERAHGGTAGVAAPHGPASTSQGSEHRLGLHARRSRAVSSNRAGKSAGVPQ